MVSAATCIQTLYKKQVTEEFKREFNIVWKGDRRCTISHKNNPDDCTACLCPSAQQHVYTLTLLDGGKVQMVDDIVGSGNDTQAVSVQNYMNNLVMQKVSRIENQLMIYLNNMRLQSNNNNTQSNVTPPVVASVLPTAAVVAVPESQTIVRDIDTPLPESISDTQRAKLKALKTLCDDGVLSFVEYQQIKKDTLASSSPSAPPQAQVVVVNDVDNSNNENRSIADEITKLKELHSTGVLSDEEFQQAKASTLASFSK